jgi:hypothetical protein
MGVAPDRYARNRQCLEALAVFDRWLAEIPVATGQPEGDPMATLQLESL